LQSCTDQKAIKMKKLLAALIACGFLAAHAPAFAAGKDDLARALIRRRLETQQRSKYLQRKRDMLQDTLAGLTARVDEQRAQLEAMRQKASLLADDTPSERPGDIWSSPELRVRDEDVEVALVHEKQRRNRA